MARMTDRAQSLLVGAVFMAVIFVSLALLLNSSLYGTTIASDASADVTGGDGAVLRDSVRDDVGYLMNRSRAVEPGSRSDQTGYVRDNVTVLDEHYGEYYAQYDRIVEIEYDSYVPGTAVSNASGNFTHDANEDGDQQEDWEIASSTRLREFRIGVSSASGPSDPFTVTFDGSETVRIYENGGGDVVVEGPDGDACEASSTTPTIDVTKATVDGGPCPPLGFVAEYDPDYSVEFSNGHQIEGRYSLIAKGSSVDGHNPEVALYSTTVDLWERTPENRYHAQIRVAPGEPR